MKKLVALAAIFCASVLFADVYIIKGKRVEGEVHEIGGGMRTLCTDERCIILPPDAVKVEDEGTGNGERGPGTGERGRVRLGGGVRAGRCGGRAWLR